MSQLLTTGSYYTTNMQLMLLVLGALRWSSVMSQRSFDPDTLKSWCIDAHHHKKEPGPEDELHKQCSPWRSRSCCNQKSSEDIHNDEKRYGINRNHCPERKLSAKCNEHFVQDLCFYDCEPNLGPWVTAVNQTFRKERFVDVPLCASDCNQWFKDCENDYTCVKNWIRELRRENGETVCPRNVSCKTFKEIYGNASTFCEKIWDGSWKYTPDDKPCMRLWFNGTAGNPNEKVRDYQIEHLVAMWNGGTAMSASLLTLSLSLLVSSFRC